MDFFGKLPRALRLEFEFFEGALSFKFENFSLNEFGSISIWPFHISWLLIIELLLSTEPDEIEAIKEGNELV